jgi:Spy/CpxP family protein refolding chaperone
MNVLLQHRSLGAAIALGVAMAFPQFAATQQQRQGRDTFREVAEKRLDELANLLNLTADQRQKARSILQNARLEAAPVVMQLKQNHEAIHNLIATSDTAVFNQRLDQLANTEGQLVSQLTRIKTRAFHEFYSMLSPDQRQKALALYRLMSSAMRLPWTLMHTGPGEAPPSE